MPFFSLPYPCRQEHFGRRGGVSRLSVSIWLSVVIVSIHCAFSGQASWSGQQQVSVATASGVVVRHSRYGKRLNAEKTDLIAPKLPDRSALKLSYLRNP